MSTTNSTAKTATHDTATCTAGLNGQPCEMCTWAKTGEKRKPAYSHSSLSTYRACPLKYQLKYELKLVSIQPVSRHDADFGNAWDAGVSTLYMPNGSLSKALEAFSTAYPADSYPAQLPVRSQGKTFANGLAALKGYVKQWREDDSHHKVLHVQERNEGGSDRILKLDLITQDLRDGEIYGWDTKTTGSYLDANYWQRFQPNSQIRMYASYIKEKFGHCGGFYINAASFKHRSRAYTPRQGPDKGIQQPAGDWFSFARMAFNPNGECLALEDDNFDYWAARIEADKASGNWGYNDQSCHMYGVDCEYLRICEPGYSWEADEELIRGYYRQMCPKVLAEGRCQLDWHHKGEHDPTVAVTEDYKIEEDEVIEDAVI